MIQRQAAFCNAKPLLKGGLHCHTTRSDGQLSPEETVRLHAHHGYDFLAVTDHRFYNYHQFAPETGVLVIPGMEMDGGVDNGRNMCFHTVCIGPEKDKGNGYGQDERVPSHPAPDQFAYQAAVDEMRAKGNLVLYCHPEWSCTPARDFEQLKGCFGMEIWNSGCVYECGQDENAAWWDDVLMRGHRFWGVATDDGHAPTHHCHGWVMVNAEKDTDAILNALEEGKFYSSTGPKITDFYVEDGVAHVQCEPVSEIQFIYGYRPARMLKGENLTEGRQEMPEDVPYVRAVVRDVHGLRAWTQPIFLK